MNRRSRSAAIAIAVLCAAPAARADEPVDGSTRESARTQAELLFQKGVEKVKAGQNAEACPLFEESDRLDAQPGTEYELAKCYESVGRLASAWARYLEVAGKLDAKGEREKAEKVRARVRDAVEPKLARLTITLPASAAQIAEIDVKRDGIPVARGLWGTAIPVDPGAHRVRVSAPGKAAWETTVDVSSAGANVVVTVPALRDDAAASPVTPPPVASPPPVAPVPATPPTSPTVSSSGQRVAGLVIGGAGVVGLAIGAGFGAAALSKASAWKTLTADKCDKTLACASNDAITEIRAVERDRSTFATASTIGFVAGGLAVAGGVVLVLTSPRTASSPTTAIAVTPFVGPLGAGAVARGAF